MSAMRAPDCNFEVIPGNTFPVVPWHGTPEEIADLSRVVLACFGGECRCHPSHNQMGQTVEIHVCPAHEFIQERDPAGRTVEWTTPACHGGFAPHSYGALSNTVSRVDRLLFARRLRGRWLAEEGILQHCGTCDAIYQVSHQCRPPGAVSGPRLPW